MNRSQAMQCKGSADFVGSDYDPNIDKKRLTGQLERIYNVLKDGKYRTLAELGKMTGDPQASISAQLRHLRKPAFGSHTIDKKRRVNRKTGAAGSWEYALKI